MFHKILEQKLQQAVQAVLPEADLSSVLIRPCPDAQFGDYQCNALMGLAKARKINPRQLATDVVAKLEVAEWCDPVTVAGAGFLNFRLTEAALAKVLQEAKSGGPLFFDRSEHPRCIVVDFSSPNVAKPMHVGHIRSTILGEALVRILRLLGHRVITDNHIGDWGTQFGKLLVGWKTMLNPAALKEDPIAEMERLYRTVNQLSETDPGTLEAARQELVKLQGGDEENLRLWQEMINLSEGQFQRVYARLGISFDYQLGESYYNSRLTGVVQSLLDAGVAQPSEGAMAVFFPEIPALKDHPALVRKSDGGYNYTTTDLATLQFRQEGGLWGQTPDEIIYVTGAPQQLHFNQLFATFARWQPTAKMKLAHVWFGSVLGDDGRPFKTRTGETVRLEALLDEAEERARAVVAQKNPDLSEHDQQAIARVVGLGAIKYADLSQNRQSDYIFNWDKMLALQGNTAPYLLYAYTRVRSIFRKGGDQMILDAGVDLILAAPAERALARHLLNFGFALAAAADEYRPNFICAYLHELAGLFAQFYENCPVLKAEGAARSSRLVLCELTARVLKQGLDVLGIETTEQM